MGGLTNNAFTFGASNAIGSKSQISENPPPVTTTFSSYIMQVTSRMRFCISIFGRMGRAVQTDDAHLQFSIDDLFSYKYFHLEIDRQFSPAAISNVDCLTSNVKYLFKKSSFLERSKVRFAQEAMREWRGKKYKSIDIDQEYHPPFRKRRHRSTNVYIRTISVRHPQVCSVFCKPGGRGEHLFDLATTE